MSNPKNWINRQVQLGWIMLVTGVIISLIGILLQRLVSDLPFNFRIITGLGILLLGIGIAYLMRYGAVRNDAQAARRLVSEERDERMLALRARAGSRAYWVSAALAYAGLMWASFAESGGLPPLDGDTLWYFLVVLVVLPFVIYASSLYYDQQKY